MSPLLVQAMLVGSLASEAAGGEALTVTYAPFEGRRTTTDLRNAEERFNLPFPDFAVIRGGTADHVVKLAMLTLLGGSAWTLWMLLGGDGGWPRPGRAAVGHRGRRPRPRR